MPHFTRKEIAFAITLLVLVVVPIWILLAKAFLNDYTGVVAMATVETEVPLSMIETETSLTIYAGTLEAGWEDWSWDTTVDMAAALPQNTESVMSITYTAPWAALYLHSQQPVDMSSYTTLRFRAHGGSQGGQQLSFWMRHGDNSSEGVALPPLPANTWVPIELALRDLGGLTMLSDLVWQEASGGTQPTFYIDEIVLVGNTATTEAPITADAPVLTIDAPTLRNLPLLSVSAIDAAFRETFDGEPTSPQTWNPPNWDVSIHTRSARQTFEPMLADHGPDCSPPPATHPISTFEQAVFICRNHMMTAIRADDYGMIYLTPDHMVDFSQGEAIIRFDLSTLRTSQRDWVDLWISPYDDHLQLPLQEWLPDGSGEPRQAVHIVMHDTNGKTAFSGKIIRDFVTEDLPGTTWVGYDEFLTPSATRRDTFELRISSSHIKFGMPEYNFWWIDTSFEDLRWDQGVLQFGHHSYTPTKCDPDCQPNTWHWDNIEISSAQPFTMLKADRRVVDANTSDEVRFNRAAPANAHLRFTAVGAAIEVSFDGGQSWQAAERQATQKIKPEVFKAYWTPIPDGVEAVLIRGQSPDDWYNGPWMVRDISIWAPTT